MTAVGSRVIAIRNSDPDTKTLYVFGAGVYAGDFPRPGTVQPQPGDAEWEMYRGVIEDPSNEEFYASIDKQMDDDLAKGVITQEQYDANKARAAKADARPIEEKILDLWEATSRNPRIDLDNGGTTWGMECWWGPEDRMLAKFPPTEWTYVEVSSVVSP